MPCFRGIDVFVGAESELERLPEFPHPDSASVSLVVRDQPTSPPGSPSPSTHSGTDGSPTRISKINPRVSMYIPSLPGVRFWIQYSVTHAPSPVCHLYFKLFADGEGITSWGIDPAKTTTGTVARALYEPDESWHCRDERGEVFKQDVIESKHFYFSDSPVNDSHTEEGRLIEVQVFRAKGRRQCAPRLDRCRSQDEHGILSPSAGLLECPDDAVFYQWLLIDPKGSPYATFRFHYRSWERLRYLNVIPPPRPESTASLFPAGALESTSTSLAASKRSSEPKLDGRQSTPGSLHDTSVKDEKQAGPAPDETPTTNIRAPFPLGNPPELLQARSSSPYIPQPSKKTRDGFLDRGARRPLPALPSRPSRAKNAALSGFALTDTPACPSSHGGATSALDLGSETAIRSPVLSPGHPTTPPPLSLSPRKSWARQDDSGNIAGQEHECPRQHHPSPQRPSPTDGTLGQHTVTGNPGHQPFPSPPSVRGCEDLDTGSQAGPSHSMTRALIHAEGIKPKWSPTSRTNSPDHVSEPGAGLGSQHDAEFDPENGIPTLPRGLLGPALTEIPLRGPTGELMKRLRSADPFRDD